MAKEACATKRLSQAEAVNGKRVRSKIYMLLPFSSARFYRHFRFCFFSLYTFSCKSFCAPFKFNINITRIYHRFFVCLSFVLYRCVCVCCNGFLSPIFIVHISKQMRFKLMRIYLITVKSCRAHSEAIMCAFLLFSVSACVGTAKQ